MGLTWINRSVYLIARTEGQPDALAAPMRRAVSNVDPTVAFFSTMTLEDRLAETLRVNRFSVFLLTSLGLVGLLLAGVGIYGVIAYFASQRTPEIGVRITLGATRTDVIRLVVAQAATPVIAGLLLGAVGAVFATRLLGSQLVNVQPTDPLTFAGVSFVLLSVALIAAFIPARRAARLDPLKALHTV